ncbi:transketolase [Patescibacteria group bacterium]|nr:transketolase [Patescibacteria group bacterium]MBU2633258.1 transketolase [Patescibacteria group bacterium]
MKNLYFVPLDEINNIRTENLDPIKKAKILSDIFRINTLYMITKAGSGHIGTSFSSMDIATWLWLNESNFIYFSSKGHDVPALYSILLGLEKLDFEMIHKFRRLGGLPGHPDIRTPNIVTNTGSLGMGISKARGIALANRLNGERKQIYVMTGDGELQEGQFWESLQPVANEKLSEITVIIDHNKMQATGFVNKTSDLGYLEKKLDSFGWEVARCNGHSFRELKNILFYFKKVKDKPKILIADTIKGKGVSFMESTMVGDSEHYKFHAGAPCFEDYMTAINELLDKTFAVLKRGVRLKNTSWPKRIAPSGKEENLVNAFGNELLKIGKENKDIVVLDADLKPDGGIEPFEEKFPERFIQCGIAEQDMVSVAGGLALKGKLPVVHSFACFLSTRPNEQIYNNATESKKIIYIGTLAGLIPGGPGHSHQSVRDISALGAMPGLTMIEPCNKKEARMAIRWAVEENKKSTYIRLCNVPMELLYSLPNNYKLKEGHGVKICHTGSNMRDLAIIGYGPILLKEAIKAARILKNRNNAITIINLPWLNYVSIKWLKKLLEFNLIVTLDNHYIKQGQGEMIASAFARNFAKHPKIISLGVKEIPACGQNNEVLKYHRLDAQSIAHTIEKEL